MRSGPNSQLLPDNGNIFIHACDMDNYVIGSLTHEPAQVFKETNIQNGSV